MTILSKLICLTAISVSIFSCGEKTKSERTDETKKFEVSAVKAFIDSSNKAFGESLSKGDSTAVAASYSSDAKIFPDKYKMMTGTDQIKAMWGGFISQKLKLEVEALDVWGDSDLVTEEGKYTVSDPSGKAVDKGKYIVLWKMSDGKWKMYRDIWNSDGPLDAQPK